MKFFHRSASSPIASIPFSLRQVTVGCILLWFTFSLGTAQACVGCRTPGESLGDPQQTIQAGLAFSWSVLFLLAVVISVVAGLSVWITKTCREVEQKHQLIPVRTQRPESPQGSSRNR